MIGELTISVSKTADGKYEYVQIASPAAAPVNIVLIADKITIQDARPGNGNGACKLPPTTPSRGSHKGMTKS